MKEYAKLFYTSKAWRETRSAYLRNADGLCERCRASGKFVPGKIVHHKKHITPNNINDPNVTLSFSNLELLCDACHNKEHKRKGNERYMFAADGSLLPPRDSSPRGCVFEKPAKEPREIGQKNAEGRARIEGG
ncbi:MAG: HNH endonuclease [Dorea sp.]|nr:HNH endonuclease [Dorea sp.]